MNKLVISQTPYRISLGGGGTDLPFYASRKGGTLITAAIDQYVKVSIAQRPLDDKILVQTTEVQFTTNLNKLKNELIRETLRFFNLSKAIQVATFTTTPTGIGLGSSSTAMVGLVNSISKYTGHNYSVMEIAKIAHYIERTIIGASGGVQDQYIAAAGGIQIINVDTSGCVSTSPLVIEEQRRLKLERHLVLIYTGQERSSAKIIKSQEFDLKRAIDVYDEIKEIGYQSVDLLINADIEGLGKAMDRHWEIKRTLSRKISTDKFDELYLNLKKLGSPGGKIVGAGGGGFFLMAVPKNIDLYLAKIKDLGYRYLDWKFEFNGTHLIDLAHYNLNNYD